MLFQVRGDPQGTRGTPQDARGTVQAAIKGPCTQRHQVPAFKALLQYMYTDTLAFENDVMVDVLKLADKYGIERVYQYCVTHCKRKYGPRGLRWGGVWGVGWSVQDSVGAKRSRGTQGSP